MTHEERGDERAMLHAIEILNAAPFSWRCTYEYPGFVACIVGATDEHGKDGRVYVTGDANERYTVDQYRNVDDWCTGAQPCGGADLGIRTRAHVDGFTLAVLFAAAVVRLEHEGGPA